MKINFSNHFQTLADRYGDREALVHVDRGRRYTFDEFHRLTNRIVNMMRDRLGLGEGDFFVNILDNDNMSFIHMPTIFKGNATGAFCNFRDSLEEHLWQVDYVKPRVVFIETSILDSHYAPLRERNIDIVCMDPPDKDYEGVTCFWDLIDGVSDDNPDIVIDDREHIGIIRFTGGTTGKGKAAAYSADVWLAMKDSILFMKDSPWHDDARTLHIAPISHGSGFFFVPTLYCGGCNVLINEPDLGLYCRTIEKEKVNTGFLVPTILYRLLDLPDARAADLSSLTTMFYGAAPMSPSKLKLLQKEFGNIFVQVYGSTEHFGIASYMSKDQHIIDTEKDEKRLSSAGQVNSNIELVICDDEGKRVPRGETGEIWLRSRSTIRGYFDNPEQTAAEFQDGFWKSGDMGQMDEDGFVYIVDRKKDMIISGGFNVYAVEVEAALGSHPAVQMSAVVGIPHPDWGEAVHAEVILRPGCSASEKELIAYVKQNIGKHKAPKSISLVEDLPVSAVGKVVRRQVKAKYWQGQERAVS